MLQSLRWTYGYALSVALILSAVVVPERALSQVSVEDEERVKSAAQNIIERTETFASAIDFAFDYGATFIATSGAPDAVVHAELASIVSRLNGVRSLLVINEDGTLRFDGFSHPAPELNLSSRPYFKAALATRGLNFGEVVLGQTSGFPFTPVSALKPFIDAVMVAVVDTRELQKPLSWCLEQCGGAILSPEGDVLVVSPSETQIPPEIVEAALAEPAGTVLVDRETFSILASWEQSEKRAVIAIAFMMVPHHVLDPIVTE